MSLKTGLQLNGGGGGGGGLDAADLEFDTGNSTNKTQLHFH